MNRKTVNPAKVARVEALKNLLSQAKSVAVVDYTGLKVSQATQLRRDIKAAGGEMKVEKNTLFRLAVGNNTQDSILKTQLQGLSAFIFSMTDEISALKPVKLPFKMGLYAGRVLTAAEIATLAQTPNLETSIARLMFLFNYHTSKLVRVLDAIARKGGEN